MQLWRWNQRRRQAYQIIVHIRRITQSRCTYRHNCRYQRIDLSKRWILYMQTIGGNAIERRIIQNYNTIGTVRSTL